MSRPIEEIKRELLSARRNMPSKPPVVPPSKNRPAPAVGQVWRDSGGKKFVILDTHSDMIAVYEDGSTEIMYGSVNSCFMPGDTYVGQFSGFMVEGCNAN